MDQTKIKEFQNRVISAGRGELLIISYDILITSLEEAIECVENKDEDNFTKTMVRAHGLLRELCENLDFKYEIAKNLMSIYIYINKQLINASIKFQKEPLIESKMLLEELLGGWEEAQKKEEMNEPVMVNSQKIFAGLTYGKNTLNEMVFDGVKQRGYKA